MSDDRWGWRDDLAEWVQGRTWWWRALLLWFLAVQALVPFRHGPFDEAWSIFGPINFGAHEFGHLFFAVFTGQFLTTLGGSLMQLLVPLGAAFAIRRANDFFGVAVCGLWLAESAAELRFYIADARDMDLDLVSFSPDGGDHDWNYLLRTLDWLPHDRTIAKGLGVIAFGIWLASVLFSLWLFVQMHRARTSKGS
ncbi:MAG: hypothetical protein K2X99_12305 [Gemmatimonadaceae bacterium]|nr:hypothetical protein [Gemmatimonadaceae bacterium]